MWGLGFFLSHGWAQYSVYWGIKWNQLVCSCGLTTASSLCSVHSFRHVYITTSLPWNSFLMRLFSLHIQSSLSLCVFVCVCVRVCVCVTYLQTSLKLSFQGTGGCILDQDPGDLNSASTFGSYYMSGLKQPLFLSSHNLKNQVNNGYFTRIL